MTPTEKFEAAYFLKEAAGPAGKMFLDRLMRGLGSKAHWANFGQGLKAAPTNLFNTLAGTGKGLTQAPKGLAGRIGEGVGIGGLGLGFALPGFGAGRMSGRRNITPEYLQHTLLGPGSNSPRFRDRSTAKSWRGLS